MRMEPIEKPRGLLLRLAYWTSRRRLGKAITPLKVVYARVPRFLRTGYALSKMMGEGFKLDPKLRILLQVHTAQQNQCAFCVDIAHAEAAHDAGVLEKALRVSDYATDPSFTARERAALRYVEEATVNRRVSDETYEELARHFSEPEICEITLVNAIENFYNMVNIPLEIESDNLCAVALARHRPPVEPAAGSADRKEELDR